MSPSFRWLAGVFFVGSALLPGEGDFTPPKATRSTRPEPIKDEQPVKLPVPDDAVRVAREDIRTLHPYSRTFTRYIFVQDGSLHNKRSLRLVSLVLQYANRRQNVLLPVPLAQGKVLRVDLRWFAFSYPKKDLEEWLNFWEELRYDPSFSLLLTRDTLEFARLDARERERVYSLLAPQTPPVLPESEKHEEEVEGVHYRKEMKEVDHPGGRMIVLDDYRWSPGEMPAGRYKKIAHYYRLKAPAKILPVPRERATHLPVVRLNSRAIDPVNFHHLQKETHSQAPVVEYHYLISRMLTTIKDKNVDPVFATILGGLYYEFAGIKTAKEVGREGKATDLDVFFFNLGVGNLDANETADKVFARIPSDHRGVQLRSGVAGRNVREFNWLPTLIGYKGGGVGSITGDIKHAHIDLGDRAYANLFTPKRDAREAIFPKLNGLVVGALFNGDGARQDEVPPDIANDYTIPKPFHQRLQAIIGCIDCHSTAQGGGRDGWQPIRNDVLDWLDTPRSRDRRTLAPGLDIFDDLGRKKGQHQAEIVDRLAGLYTGSFLLHMERAQHDLASATLRAVGDMWESDKIGWGGKLEPADSTQVCRLAAEYLHLKYGEYHWEDVTAKVALADLGVQVKDPKQAAELWAEIFPPDVRGLEFQGEIGAFIKEDPRISGFRPTKNKPEGHAFGRMDWILARDFAAERALRSPVYRQLRGLAPLAQAPGKHP